MAKDDVRNWTVQAGTVDQQWVYTTAHWNEVAGLRVSHEVDSDSDLDRDAASSSVVYRVPPERAAELLSALPSAFTSVPAAIDWACAGSDNAATLRRTLAGLEPSVVVLQQYTRR